MARYVDGFVIALPKRKVATYRRIARAAGKVWMEHGALEYREAVGEDLAWKWGMPFPRIARARKGDTVVFSWIVFRSRKDRDRVNGKVMKDARLAKMMQEMKENPIFDMKRMAYGGFDIIVDMTS